MSPDSLSAADLLVQARSGDRRALRHLCERQRPKLEEQAAHALGATVGDKRQASTTVDELLAGVEEQFFRFRGSTEEEFSTWLIDQLRVRARQLNGKGVINRPRSDPRDVGPGPPQSFEWFEAGPQDETVVVAKHQAESRVEEGTQREEPRPASPECDGILSVLAELQRRVVRGRLLEGRSLADLAGQLNLTPPAVVGLFRLGLQSLRFAAAGNPDDQQTWAPPSRGAADPVDDILARYLAFRDAGDGVTPRQLFQEHPDHQAALSEFFELEKEWKARLTSSEATLAPDDPRAKALPPPPRLSRPPESFGDYDILEPIARGGMGVVYKARQKSLDRIVAVKMVLAGAHARKEEIDRFYNEASNAARLTHPNIVRIYEVGQTEGQPYFSMDFIEGESLADLLARGPLSETRAAYFSKLLADAIEYAHSQGIIHRDLKPANVLLDRRSSPHITDFGLAKRVEADLRITATGAVLGTPNYMPPEQAAGKIDEICPASDVYGLGAILYEMLTGRPPFEAATSYDVLTQVLKHEPAAPRSINPAVPIDLETICEKCLRKEPADRYQSAQDLSDELQRYLDGEPISARPMSIVERTTGWCRRNPAMSTLTGALLAAVVIAIGTIVVSLIQTRSAWEVADASFRDAKGAVDDFFVRVSEESLLHQPGLQVVRRDLLERAAEYYRKFLARRAGDPALREELAETKFRVGKLTEELESPEAAIKWYDEAIGEQRQLANERPRELGRKTALGDTLNARAVALQRLKKMKEARVGYLEALQVRKDVADMQAQNVEAQRKLANTRMNLGLLERDEKNAQAALSLFDEAQETRLALLKEKEDPRVRRDLGLGYYNLGTLAMGEGDPELARESFKSAIATFEELTTRDDEREENRASLALCYRLLADLTAEEKQLIAADALYEKARGQLERLSQENPSVLEYTFDLAGTYMNLGRLAEDRKDLDRARQQLATAIKLLEGLAMRAKGHPRLDSDLKKARVALEKLGS